MTASIRHTRWGAPGLAVFGILALLMAFLPGTANADEALVVANPGGNAECPEETVEIAKFNRVGETADYVAEYGGDIVTLTNTTKTGGAWSSTVEISHLFVKGGNDNDGGTLYDPSGLVRRDQMASFQARTLDHLVEHLQL